MDELHRALGDIRSLRRQVARSTEFRGYGPLAIAATSGFGTVAATVQSRWITVPLRQMHGYLTVWAVCAVVSLGLVAFHAITRSRRMHSGLADEMIRIAAGQFLPCLLLGVTLTWVVVYRVPELCWTLPAMWHLLFSLGIFASCRFLSRTMVAAGVWYAGFGLMALSLGGPDALAPWVMGVGFGVGQMLVAAVLAFTAAKEQGDEI